MVAALAGCQPQLDSAGYPLRLGAEIESLARIDPYLRSTPEQVFFLMRDGLVITHLPDPAGKTEGAAMPARGAGGCPTPDRSSPRSG